MLFVSNTISIFKFSMLDFLCTCTEGFKKNDCSMSVKSDEFEQVMMSCLTDLGSIKLRDQPLGDAVVFDSDAYSLTTTKVYPSELSNMKIGDLLQFPDSMTNYLVSVDLRKPLSVRVWKNSVQAVSNQSIETVDGVEITTTFTPVDYTLTLDFGSSGQLLNIPQNEKLISYFFQVNKAQDSSDSQVINGIVVESKIKQTNVSSEMFCLSDADCLTEQVDINLFVC